MIELQRKGKTQQLINNLHSTQDVVNRYRSGTTSTADLRKRLQEQQLENERLLFELEALDEQLKSKQQPKSIHKQQPDQEPLNPLESDSELQPIPKMNH